jgi:hypothetical protein
VPKLHWTKVESGLRPAGAVAGVDPTTDLGVRAALVGGITRLFPLIFPIRAHGTSTPDPNRFRRELMGACWACRAELSKLTLEAPTDTGLTALATLDRCAMGELWSSTLDSLRELLVALADSPSAEMRAAADTVKTALDAYDLARQEERRALVEWTKRGRIPAETVATTELHYRAHDAALRLKADMPGSAFALGAGLGIAGASIASLFEREQVVAEAADAEEQASPIRSS